MLLITTARVLAPEEQVPAWGMAMTSNVNNLTLTHQSNEQAPLRQFVCDSCVAVSGLHAERSSSLFELARVLVRFDHVASIIVNANHSVIRAEAVRVHRMVTHFSVPLR